MEYRRISGMRATLDSLKIRQRPRTRVDGAVQARVADAEVVKGTSDVRQKRIPLAKDDTFGLGESEWSIIINGGL